MVITAAKEQILAAFVVDNGKTAERFLKKVQAIDKADENVVIVDAAIAEKNRFGRVKIHQTIDRGGVRGGVRGGTIGVVVGTILLGPAGAVIGGAAGGILAGLHNRFHDIGVDDKFMRDVGKHIDRGMSILFVLYEGNWSHSIGAVEDAIKAEGALLLYSDLSPEKPPHSRRSLKLLSKSSVEQKSRPTSTLPPRPKRRPPKRRRCQPNPQQQLQSRRPCRWQRQPPRHQTVMTT